MNSYRIEKLAQQFREAATQILMREVENPRLRSLVITRVYLTKDLSLARFYYESLLPADLPGEREGLQDGLNRAKRFIRKEIAARIKLRLMPQIEFFYDETSREIHKVEQLFEKL